MSFCILGSSVNVQLSNIYKLYPNHDKLTILLQNKALDNDKCHSDLKMKIVNGDYDAGE